jgi:hypothetical protein
MARFRFLIRFAAAAVTAGVLGAGTLAAQATSPSLGRVRVARDVIANGQRLPAGSYTVRLTGDKGKPVVGQTTEASQWVEFVQGDQVKGRELATVLTAADAKAVAKGGARPAAGGASAVLLKGGDYIRVWINRAGTHYLLHLSVAP